MLEDIQLGHNAGIPKLSPANLQRRNFAVQFGIADVTTFDYGDHIRSKGLSNTWNHAPLTGLSLEFFRFLRQEALHFFRTLIPNHQAVRTTDL